MSSFGIKAGYVESIDGPAYFVDDAPQDRGLVHQPDVYRFAADIAIVHGLTKVVDLGCGRADKLAEVHEERPSWEYVGIDHGPNLQWCHDHYDWGDWWDVDLENGLSGARFVGAVVVMADVIEHLRDPRPILGDVSRSGAARVVISTPERDLTYGVEHDGPPPNLCHVREWNRPELESFLGGCGFALDHVGLTRSSNQSEVEHTTLVLARPLEAP